MGVSHDGESQAVASKSSSNNTNHNNGHFSMGRVKKRTASTAWDSNHATLYQRGFRDLHWGPLETKGPAIKEIVEGAIAADPDFGALRWLFSKAQGGEKDNNNNLYLHYKTEASEYITQLARIGIRSRCCPHVSSWCAVCCVLFLRFTISHFISCLHMHPFQSTENFLDNSSVQGGRASVGKVAAAAGTVGASDDDEGEVESDDEGEELEGSDSDSDDDDDDATTTKMVTKTKGSIYPRKKASSSGGGRFQKQEGARWDAGARGPLQK
jgi:hypothetical protein